MSKVFTLFIALFSMFFASAQLVPVTYRGAFAPAPTPMWTDGWAEWNPNAIAYPAATVTISGNISANTTWTANNVYELSGVVSIDSLITLSIEPGTIIRGDNNVPNSCLIVRRGAKLNAVGTACKPIVFTSDKAAGSRAPGDWGGIIILGRATTNTTSGVSFIEGLNNIPESQYGGGASPVDNDNSGVLSYVRIEFGGYVFQQNVEINGLTLGAVGKGTQIDHVQCSFTNDDSFEWFGGTVNCSHLVAYRGVDDNWDTDNGFSGKVQFCLGVRDPDLYDPTYTLPSGGSSSEGFESDNDAGGSNNTPRTSAVFSNVTDIGPLRGSAAGSDIFGFRRAARLRRNTELKIYNSILMDWRTGLFIDGSAAEANAVGGTLRFRNNIIAGAGTNRNILRSSAAANYAGIANIDSVASTANILVRPYQFLSPDYRPANASIALAGADFADAVISNFVTPVMPIKKVTYRGAFAPAPTPMWTDGWAEWNPNAIAYPAATVTISGNISANTTWTANNVYELSGVVSIDSLITLSIEPGTIIRGDNNVPNSCLIVRRGAKLNAVGTACKPIVFTSDKAAGSRAPGDWGGIIILGRATTNTTSGVSFIEGLNNIPESQYGGGASPVDNDNSGVLSYVRIEFGGYVFQQNVEINGLTLGAVGKGTQIDHVQCSFTNDDSFEWFGGTVNCSHLVAYRGVDDNWDTDNGFSGKVQFCLGVRDPDLYDPTYTLPSGGSSSEGFESDNDAGGSNNTPRTSAVFSNVTDIGPLRGSAAGSDIFGFRRAARLRRNTELKIYNSILMDWRTGLFIDGSAAEANAVGGTLRFRNNIIAGAGTNRNILRSSAAANYAGIANIDSVASTANILIRPYEFLTPDYRPADGSIALSNYDFSDPVLPVRLMKFTGETIKRQNQLYWETASENDNAGFELLRSANGRDFSKIGFVSSNAINGNSSAKLSYSFLDEHPFEGESYYKLNQVDKNGRTVFSNVVLLNNGLFKTLNLSTIYPNPVFAELHLVFNAPVQQDVVLVINDVSGRALSQEKISLSKGANNHIINVQKLVKGNYFIKVQPVNGDQVKVQQFIKK